jgi:hypothetical protein
MIKLAIPAVLIACGIGLAACGGGSSKKTPTQEASPSVRHVANTGDGAIDQVLDQSLAPDRIEMARLTFYHRVPCAATADATHPDCPADAKPDDAVEVLPKLGCDAPGFVHPEAVPDAYAAVLHSDSLKLSGVYVPVAAEVHWEEDAIAVIATGKHDSGADAGVALHLKGGRIAAIEDDCGDILRLLDESRVKAWLVRPGADGPSETPTG